MLQENDKAPEFSSVDQHGKVIRLSDYRGKKVILYFYPKDNTPGCTEQSCNLRDNYTSLKRKGYEVLGISNDSEKSHLKFLTKFKLPFTLVVDEDKKIVNNYGVYGEKIFWGRKYMGILRTTFVIDEEGVIKKIIRKVDTKEHAQQIISEMAGC